MSLSLIDYGSREEAREAAEALGYERDMVNVSKEPSGRWQWDLRVPGEDEVAATVATSPSDAMRIYFPADAAQMEREAMPEVEVALSGLDMPVDASNELGEIEREASAEPFIVEAEVVSDTTLIASDGVGVDHVPVVEDAAIEVASDAVIEAGPDVVAVDPVPDVVALRPVADVALRVAGLLTEEQAAEMASYLSSKVGMALDLVRGDTVLSTVFPGAKRAVKPAAEASTRKGRRYGVDFDWSTYSEADIPATNASCATTWRAIRDAAARLDMDALMAFNFKGSNPDDGTGNTYTQYNGRYLRAMIGKTERAIAERDAALAAKREAEAGMIQGLKEAYGCD